MNDKLFKKELKKLEARKMLLKYKNELNKKQWDKLHKIISKETREKKEIKYTHFIVAIIIILIFALAYKGNYAEQIQKCRNIKGHICSNYEIDKIFNSKEN